MPHDKNGKLIQNGDTVTLTGVCENVCPGEEYCNVTVRSPYTPPKQMGFCVTLCTQEVEKVDSVPVITCTPMTPPSGVARG